MRRHLFDISDDEPRARPLEYGLTAALAVVVIAALLQIAGFWF